MSFEKNLERIATALESIAASVSVPTIDVKSEPVSVEKVLTAEAPAAPVKTEDAPEAPAAPADSGAPTPPKSSATDAISSAELNTILGLEFARIGNVREPIDKVMKDKFSVDSIHNLPAENYAELVKAIADIPSA